MPIETSKLSERRKPVVMVADDEPLIRETILEILRDEGFDAIGVSDGAAGLRWAEKARPDIILTDVVMPVMNGIDLAMRARDMLPECRIILFSGNVDSNHLLNSAQAHGLDFEVFAKPIKPELLVNMLRSGLKRASGE